MITFTRKEISKMFLIQNGLLYTMEDMEPVRGDILIDEGKIIQIEDRIKEEDVLERCKGETYEEKLKYMKVIDAEGLSIYPGLIDAHSHIGILEEKTGAQGDDCNEDTYPITPTLRAIDAINPLDSAFHNALAVGVTGVMVGPGSSNVIGGQFAFIKTYGRCIDDMVVLAPAAIKVAFGENPKENYGEKGKMPDTRMGIADLIRRELFRARKYFQEEAGLKRSYSIEEQDFELESYRDLFAGKIPLKAHVHRTDDIFTAMRIAREFGLELTLDHCTQGHLIAEEIGASGYPVIVGPGLASRSKNELSMSDFKTAGILHKAGVMVAITTDHPVSRIQHLPVCAALSAREGLGEINALRGITIDAARICKVDHRVGSLKVGKDADLILMDGSPLDLNSRLQTTIIDGRIVWNPPTN